jgi:hypothetical protein
LIFEQEHSISLCPRTGVRIDFQSRCHVRMPKLSLRDFQRRSL